MRKTITFGLVLLAACTGAPKLPTEHAHKEPKKTSPWVTQVSIKQRRTEYVPAGEHELQLQIDDITAGQVLTRVSCAYNVLVGQRSMQCGDVVAFRLDGEELSLGLSRLVNLLIGDDFALFHVGTTDAVAKAQIQSFIDRVGRSTATFRIGGREVDAKEAKRQLERDLERRKCKTARAFLDDVVRKPRSRGGRYEIVIANRPMPLADWLRGTRSRD